MSGAEHARPAMPGVMIAMTDLFVSATATLMVVLILSQTERPTPLPVQADLVAFCPTEEGEAFAVVPVSAVIVGADRLRTSMVDTLALSDATGLAAVLAKIAGAEPRSFYSIGLAGTAGRPVTAACISRLQNTIVRMHNQAVGKTAGGIRAIAGVTVISRPVILEDGDE